MKRELAAVMAIATGVLSATADDWPHWRGPTRDGHTRETSGWSSGDWPYEAPAWETNVGEGCTAPVIVRGRLYTLGWHDDRDTIVCLDARTGAALWRQSYDCPRYGRHHTGDEDAYSGPTATPEFDPESAYLYTLSTDGDLACWDTFAEGRRVWGFNLYEEYSVPQRPEVGKVGTLRDYGYITAPFVHGDSLIVAVGAPEGHLMAFDKRTGARSWVSETKEPAGHCGGLTPIEVEGTPCLASLTLRKLVVLRLDAGNEGRTVAEYAWETDFGNNVASPAVHENFVLITSAYNHGTMRKLQITHEGARDVWDAPYPSGACTPVIHADRIYWVWESLHCLDFTTGELKWREGSFGSPGSCIMTADNKLIAWGGRGRLALVEPADAYQELSRRIRVFQAYCWPHVAIADGRLYCKDRDGNIKALALSR